MDGKPVIPCCWLKPVPQAWKMTQRTGGHGAWGDMWGFPKSWGSPIAGWFRINNLNIRWMIWGCHHELETSIRDTPIHQYLGQLLSGARTAWAVRRSTGSGPTNCFVQTQRAGAWVCTRPPSTVVHRLEPGIARHSLCQTSLPTHLPTSRWHYTYPAGHLRLMQTKIIGFGCKN